MANEIWGPIKTPIKNQIELRQKLMSQNSNYKQRMTYLNKKCDIRVTPLSYDLTSENTYSNFIFNNDYIEGIEGTGRIGNSYKSKIEKPFVENFELENRTGANDKVGVIRTGKMSIKIFTREQFNLIEKYFRIGSAILIEWGWGSYVLSGGSIEYFKTNLYNENAIKNTRILNENDILSHIETKTLESEGNYDAAIMFITNFNVSFENGVNDFYYTLNVDFVGKSLLLNELVLNKAENEDTINSERSQTNDDKRIFTNKLVNLLRFIETISNKDNIPENIIRSTQDTNTDSQTLSISLLEENQTTKDELIRNLFVPEQESIKEIINNVVATSDNNINLGTSLRIGQSGVIPSNNPLTGIITIEESTNMYSYNFITLEYFLNLLKTYFSSFSYDPKDQTYSSPTLASKVVNPINSEINTGDSEVNFINEDESDSLNFLYDSLSLDTRICILPSQIGSLSRSSEIKKIHLRVTYLLDTLIKLIKSNNFTFNDIIAIIIDDINRATADEIKLEYYPIDEEGKYTIISNTSFKIDPETRNNLLSLKIYERSAVGSIVEEVNIDTTIDSKVSNTVAIASLGQPLNEISNESFGLLKFNKNIKSRLKLTEFDKEQTPINEIYTRIKKNNEFFYSKVPFLTQFKNNKEINFDTDDIFVELIQTWKQIRTDLINLSLFNSGTISRSTPLIPVLYNFSMPGISGLYNTSVLKIVDERLPDIYKTTNSYFIITGIKHTINNREWKTSVKTNFQLS
jgi:hypothetical protein